MRLLKYLFPPKTTFAHGCHPLRYRRRSATALTLSRLNIVVLISTYRC